MWKCASTSGWKKYPAVIKHGLLGKPCQYRFEWENDLSIGKFPQFGGNIHTILSQASWNPPVGPCWNLQVSISSCPMLPVSNPTYLGHIFGTNLSGALRSCWNPHDFFGHQKFTNQMGEKTSHLQVRSILVIYICTYTYNIYIYTYI